MFKQVLVSATVTVAILLVVGHGPAAVRKVFGL
jgi:hypothetical protein